MQFENFNVSLFRGFFGNELYESVRNKEFSMRVISEPKGKSLGFVRVEENIVGTKKLVLCFNMGAVNATCKALGFTTDADLKRLRTGVLIHELTHLDQVLSGRLVVTPKGVIWEGVKYPLRGNCRWSYVKTPWEKEAYINQVKFTGNLTDAQALEEFNKMVNSVRPMHIRVIDKLKTYFA